MDIVETPETLSWNRSPTVTRVSPFGAAGFVGSASTEIRLMSISGGSVSGLVVTKSTLGGRSVASSAVKFAPPQFFVMFRILTRTTE